MPSARLTKTSIAALKAPKIGNQILYQDQEQPALAVRVTANGARSFIVDKNTSRGRIRITLGPAGTDDMTVPHAREKARIAIGLISEGYTREQIEDRLARAEERIPEGAITLNDVLQRYLAERAHRLAERTKADYPKLVKTYLPDWQHRPLEVIDETAVVAKFAAIKSPSRANYTMRLLRALFRYARSIRDEEGKPIVISNPVDVLSQRRLWHATPARRDVIKPVELPEWWKAVKALDSEANHHNADAVRDWLVFLILTGLRRGEASRLTWEDVDLRAKTFTVPDTKNREPHTLPLSDYLFEMLTRRRAARGDGKDEQSRYVFPGERGPLVEPKKQIGKVVAASGVPFSAHTLRRTFGTIAESIDIPYAALKALLNHKTSSADITLRHYLVLNVERLRGPMQKITDYIIKAAGERPSATVIPAERGERREGA